MSAPSHIILPNMSASDLSDVGNDSLTSCASDSDSSVRRKHTATFLQPLKLKYRCSHCPLSFRRRDALDKHESQHTGQRKYQCTVSEDCVRFFTNDSHLRRHVRTVHKDNPRAHSAPVRCSHDGCTRFFGTTAAMTLHVTQTHAKRRLHQCHDCTESFYRKQQLKTHRYVHTGEYPYRCDGRCGAGFLTKKQQDRHQRNCARAIERLMGGVPDGEEGDAGGDGVARVDLVKTYKCSKCDITFGRWSALVSHRRLEHPPHCALCDRSFSTQTNLRMHNANVHADDQNRTTYPCDEPTCDKSFTARRNMRSHWHLKHAPLQDRQFVCDRCSLPLSGKRKLELHIEWHERNPDAKIRPLRVSTHLCEVPFCGRKYVRRQALVEHYRKAHPDEAVPESPVQRPTVAERLAGVRDGGEEGEEEEVEEEETEETEEVGGDKAKAGDDDDLLSGT